MLRRPRSSKGIFRGVLALGLAFAANRESGATTFVVGTDADLLEASQVVIRGKVVELRTLQDDHGLDTVAKVAVTDTFKGATDSTVFVRLRGGQWDGHRHMVYGSAQMAPDEDVLLFLRDRGDGTFATAQMAMGKYGLVEAGGQTMAVRDLSGATVLHRRRGRVVPRRPQEVRRLANLAASIRAGGAAAEGDEEESISPHFPGTPPFSTLGTASRWYETDGGQPLIFQLEPSGAAATGLDAEWIIHQAMSAWSDVDCARLDLQLAGGGDIAPSNVCDGRSQITFGDPFGEVDPPRNCSGIVGVGSFCSLPDGRIVNGQVFNRITEGDVVINDGFEGCDFWNDVNLSEVFTHEIGHTLGLGHSSEKRHESTEQLKDAVMYYASHFDGRGAAIMDDDRDGICWIYPTAELQDDDGDGVNNDSDICADTPDPQQIDTDRDGTGDACDWLTITRTMLSIGDITGRSHLKISGLIRPQHAFVTSPASLTLSLRTGAVLVHQSVVAAADWTMSDDGTHLSAKPHEASAITSIDLYQQADDSYKFRIRGRGVEMFRPAEEQLTVEIAVDDFDAESTSWIRETEGGRFVFP